MPARSQFASKYPSQKLSCQKPSRIKVSNDPESTSYIPSYSGSAKLIELLCPFGVVVTFSADSCENRLVECDVHSRAKGDIVKRAI
jgi:hypothetical protein